MKFALLVAVGLTLCMAPGCMTSRPANEGDPIKMTLLPSGQVQLGDSSLPPTALPKALGRIGATPKTILIIHIGDQTPLPEVKSLTERLATAGYRHVYFKRPQHARSNVITP